MRTMVGDAGARQMVRTHGDFETTAADICTHARSSNHSRWQNQGTDGSYSRTIAKSAADLWGASFSLRTCRPVTRSLPAACLGRCHAETCDVLRHRAACGDAYILLVWWLLEEFRGFLVAALACGRRSGFRLSTLIRPILLLRRSLLFRVRCECHRHWPCRVARRP